MLTSAKLRRFWYYKVYFLKVHMSVYLCAKFQVSSIPLTSFRQGGGEEVVHSTSWKFSTWWTFSLYFVYIFIADSIFLTKFCSSDPSFNGNILISLYLKSETFALAQLCDYSFIHTIYKFRGMVLAGNSH